jgi:hypothetical protein
MATTRQSISCMIKNYRKTGKEFFWSNYKLSKKLNKSEKTIANTISLMRREGELEALNYGKIRYLKLSDPKIKNIIPDAVKKFYKVSGRKEGVEKGAKSGTPIYNINISKAKASFNKHIITESVAKLVLVADIKKEIPNFKTKVLEKLVCDVNNEKLIRSYLKEFIKNLNPGIENPAGLFTNNLREKLKDLQNEIATAKLEQKRSVREEKLKALKKAELREKKEAALKGENEINKWIDNYILKFSEIERQNNLKEFIFNSENLGYLNEADKNKMINEYKLPENLGYGDKISFKKYFLKKGRGSIQTIMTLCNTIMS